jgi:O-antigen/teichoic acid export membrane protein
MTDAALSAGDRTRKVLAAGAWTMVERVVSQAAQFVIFIVAARVLGPAEFGVFALISA